MTAHRFRLGTFGFPGSDAISVCRFVVINAFYFYVMLFPATLSTEQVDETLLEFRKNFRFAFRLRPTRRSVEIKVSRNTLEDVYRDQFRRELPAWEEYFSKVDPTNL